MINVTIGVTARSVGKRSCNPESFKHIIRYPESFKHIIRLRWTSAAHYHPKPSVWSVVSSITLRSLYRGVPKGVMKMTAVFQCCRSQPQKLDSFLMWDSKDSGGSRAITSQESVLCVRFGGLRRRSRGGQPGCPAGVPGT